MIVGILGGVGSGKSIVAHMFVELGAEAIDADALAHEALEAPAVREAVVNWMGPKVIGSDGKVDRMAVGQRVFSSGEELRRLEALVHPEVLRRIEERILEHRERRPPEAILVLDVPLLLDSPLQDQCDRLVFVSAGCETRRDRVRTGRGWSPAELERRESHQPSPEEKMRHADYRIDNEGDIESTRRQVQDIYARLVRLGSLKDR